MERLVLRGKSKEDMKLIADVARKMGISVEYSFNEEISTVEEPAALAEWDRLSTEQQQGILDAVKDIKTNGGRPHDEVMKAMRKKYE